MGGSGGGGSAGEVDYPAYMEAFQGSILDHGGADTITSSTIDLINAALGNSPFAAAMAYDPLARVTMMGQTIIDFVSDALADVDDDLLATYYAKAAALIDGDLAWPTIQAMTRINALDPNVVDTYLDAIANIDTNLGDDTDIDADVAAFADRLDLEITSKVLPRFEGGMRDINAVVSSAFTN